MAEPVHGRRVSITELGARPRELIAEVKNASGRLIIEEDGVMLAAIVGTSDVETLDRLDRDRVARFEILDRLGALFGHEAPEASESLARLAVDEARSSAPYLPGSDRS